MGSDYHRVERAIALLVSNGGDVAATSAALGLSEDRLGHLFTAWAGVSPARFARALRWEDARRRLQEGREGNLGASLGVGLSGPGRLHDLAVTLVAATPGEVATGGEGLEIRHGWVETPFGHALMGATSRGCCFLAFEGPDPRAAIEAELRSEWPKARLVEDAAASASLAATIFAGLKGGPHASLAVHVRGTQFQIRVWEALLRLAPGEVTDYSAIAREAGNPAAVRAAASAVAANRVAVLIPCHRVLRREGALGGYRWGTTRKAALLGWEASAWLHRDQH